MKRSSIKPKPTRRSKQAQRHYKAFGDRWRGKACCICHAERGCHRHHIVNREGDDWDDERNLLWVCKRCHDRLHGISVVVARVRIPGWEKKDAFIYASDAKQRWDAEYYDPAYLDYLRNWERHYRETGRTEYQEVDDVPTDL